VSRGSEANGALSDSLADVPTTLPVPAAATCGASKRWPPRVNRADRAMKTMEGTIAARTIRSPIVQRFLPSLPPAVYECPLFEEGCAVWRGCTSDGMGSQRYLCSSDISHYTHITLICQHMHIRHAGQSHSSVQWGTGAKTAMVSGQASLF